LEIKALTNATNGIVIRLIVVVRVTLAQVRVPGVLGIVAVRCAGPIIGIGTKLIADIFLPLKARRISRL